MLELNDGPALRLRSADFVTSIVAVGLGLLIMMSDNASLCSSDVLLYDLTPSTLR